MKLYSVYDALSGQVIRTGQCQDETFDLQAAAGEIVIEGEYPDDRFFMADGKPVAMPPRPSAVSVFDYAIREWRDPRSLDQIKAEARARVVAFAEDCLGQFTADYPTEEVLSWGSKLTAARRVLAGGTEAIIQIEADALGVTAEVLAARVVSKGGAYEAMVARAAAFRGRAHAAINAAATELEIAEIVDRALSDGAVQIMEGLTDVSSR